MYLHTLGKLELEPLGSKLGPQSLLLLSYVSMEGLIAKTDLARLFWSHLAEEVTAKGERKDIKNLGVCLAGLKRELAIDLDAAAKVQFLKSDALELETAFLSRTWQAVLDLNKKGEFLAGLEHKPRLNLGSEIYSWLMNKRERFADYAKEACLNLAEQLVQSEKYDQANELLNANAAPLLKLHDLDLLEPAFLTRLYRLFLSLGHPSVSKLRQAFESYLSTALNDELISKQALQVLLALSLQVNLNLVAVQRALNLSPKQLASCREELIAARLLGANSQVLANDIATYYLEQHPSLHISLLSSLIQHTAAEHALPLFQSIYKASHTFGGMGYWPKALQAYTVTAKKLIQEEHYTEALALLNELRQAEETSQQDPSTQSRFLLAYCLERLEHYKEGLAVLSDVAESSDIRAIKALFLLKAGQFQAAKALAEQVMTEVLSSHSESWARAIAANVLGQISYEEAAFFDAESYFDESAAQWQAAQMPKRVLGAIMNRANVFERLGEKHRAREIYKQVILASDPYPVLKIHAFLNLGYLAEQEENWHEALVFYEGAHNFCLGLGAIVPALLARVHNNYGYSLWQTKQPVLAIKHLNEAIDFALEAGERLTYAKALGNLALIHSDVGKMEASLRLLQEMGAKTEQKSYQHLFVKGLEEKIKAARDDNPDALEFYQRKKDYFEQIH